MSGLSTPNMEANVPVSETCDLEKMAAKLTEAQWLMLLSICLATESGRIGGRGVGQFTPYDFGGGDGSNDSAVLTQLARKGLVDQKWLGLDWNVIPKPNRWMRGSKCYRASPLGLALRNYLTTQGDTPC
jgi:hypothetical protein